MTVKTALAVLEKQELIFRKRQGPGHPNRIYVKIPKETLSNTDRILSSRQTENCPIDRQDSFPDTDRKLSSNKKEIKKNHLTIRGSKEPRSPYGTFQNVFLSETELENIRQTIPDWQDYMERLSGYMASTGKHTKTMQLPSSVGQDRIILFPGNEIMKVRNTKHYDNIYRKTNSYHTKQRASV